MEVWLPSVANWNKRIHNITLGGFGGNVLIGDTTQITSGTAPYLTGVTWGIAMNEGAVSAVNDGGHADPAGTGSFAMNPDGTINSTLWTDLATRATHEMTLKTKALVAAYYLTPHSYAYVDGCSGGGRQGLAEAQSFPDDYNGILAGAPSIAQTRFFPADLYPGFVQFKDLGSYSALSAAQLALVSGAAVSACDATLTGQHDGYINDPATCNYDPTTDPSVLCTASGGTNSTSSCVTIAQAQTFNKVWYGPTFGWIGAFAGGRQRRQCRSLSAAAMVGRTPRRQIHASPQLRPRASSRPDRTEPAELELCPSRLHQRDRKWSGRLDDAELRRIRGPARKRRRPQQRIRKYRH